MSTKFDKFFSEPSKGKDEKEKQDPHKGWASKYLDVSQQNRTQAC